MLIAENIVKLNKEVAVNLAKLLYRGLLHNYKKKIDNEW